MTTPAEAMMAALHQARGGTERPAILESDGHYGYMVLTPDLSSIGVQTAAGAVAAAVEALCLMPDPLPGWETA